MERKRRSWAVAVLVLAIVGFATTALAQERNVFGARSLGMGGISAAFADNATAVYGNAAGMAFLEKTDFQFPLVTFSAEIDGPLVSEIQDIDDLVGDADLDQIVSGIESGDADTRKQARRLSFDLLAYEVPDLGNEGLGLVARANLGPAFRYKNWAVAIGGAAYAGVDPITDLENGLALSSLGLNAAVPFPSDTCGGDAFCEALATELVTIAQAGGEAISTLQAQQLVVDATAGFDPSAAGVPVTDFSRLRNDAVAQQVLKNIVRETATDSPDPNGETFADNRSGTENLGVTIQQAAFGYSRKIFDKLAVGGTIRVMRGETYRSRTILNDLENGDELYDDLVDDDSTESSTEFAVDASAMYRPIESVSIGLVARNLNAPSFEFAAVDGEARPDFELEQQVLIGAAWQPKKFFTVAAEYDLNEIDSQLIGGTSFQYARVGLEAVALKILAFRLGAYDNLAADSSEVLTGGLGVRLGRFELALSGAYSTDTDEFVDDGSTEEVPLGVGFALQFGWNRRF